MIINRERLLNELKTDQMIRISIHIIILIFIWIIVWIIEEILYSYTILKLKPVLIIPTSLSLSVLLSYLLKLSITFIYFSKISFNINSKKNLPLKVITKKNYCFIPGINLGIFGFECHLPIRDQIKNIENISDLAPFTVEINWANGIFKIFFFRSQIDQSEDNFIEILHFLEKSFNKSKELSPNIVKDILLESLSKQTKISTNCEYISKNEEFSEIIRSLKSNDDFLKENHLNEEFNYSIDIQSIIYWQFDKKLLSKFSKMFRFSQQFLKDLSLGKIIYILSANIDSDDPNKASIMNFPPLGLPPLKMIKENERVYNAQLLLFIFNKWMFRNFSSHQVNNDMKNNDNIKNASSTKKTTQLVSQIPKKDQSLDDYNLIQKNPQELKKTIEKNNDKSKKNEIKQTNGILLDNKTKLISKDNKTQLKDYIQDVKPKSIDNIDSNVKNDNSINIDYNKAAENFSAALDMLYTEKPSKNTKNENIKEKKGYHNWVFSDFCKNFCSMYKEMSKVLSYPSGECLNYINKNSERVKKISLIAKKKYSEERSYNILVSTVKTEKLNTDEASCFFNSLQNLQDKEGLISLEMKYLIFREIFL